ncbi:hypothetical protein SELMODRAFT_405394 [Selaginella moellendorffii]|uniref:Uncharacterized protein n=1 Tax=Selaginella moellendorffii TaxID=88036 RepID=D8QX74_SELML|nr:hypothetical protein SELMODRAFT_405394 [Selaginella moellendorffii]
MSRAEKSGSAPDMELCESVSVLRFGSFTSGGLPVKAQVHALDAAQLGEGPCQRVRETITGEADELEVLEAGDAVWDAKLARDESQAPHTGSCEKSQLARKFEPGRSWRLLRMSLRAETSNESSHRRADVCWTRMEVM